MSIFSPIYSSSSSNSGNTNITNNKNNNNNNNNNNSSLIHYKYPNSLSTFMISLTDSLIN